MPMNMQLNDKIYVAGHNGLVGSAILRQLKAQGYHNFVTASHSKLELTSQQQVNEFFAKYTPDFVFLAAAKVGGIYANNTYPADFIYQNLMVQNNVLQASFENKVKGLMFLGSSCIYPKEAAQPMREEALLTGYLEPTNEPYAVAKIAGIKQCESYNRQHDTDFRSVMPTNLYGEGDNFHPENSHVLPALLRRFHEATEQQQPIIEVWGSGKPRREFLYVDDMALASIHVMNLDKATWQSETQSMCSHINVGYGEDISIAELAQLVAEVTGYQGEIKFDISKPDGTMQKLMDSSKLRRLGWQPTMTLAQGIEKTYAWYLEQSKTDQIREV